MNGIATLRVIERYFNSANCIIFLNTCTTYMITVSVNADFKVSIGTCFEDERLIAGRRTDGELRSLNGANIVIQREVELFDSVEASGRFAKAVGKQRATASWTA